MYAHALHTVHRTISGTDPSVILVDIGTAAWLVAYLIAIVRGFRRRTYCLPLVAIASNFTWEVLASFEWVAPIKAWHIGAVAWMLMDGFIVYQLLAYGRAAQQIPELRTYYRWVLGGTFLLALLGQWTYSRYYGDELGFEDAYVINTTMSILFIFMYFARREADSATLAIGWLKLFGTGITSVGLIRAFPLLYPERTELGFMHFLWLTILLFDLIYVGLLHRERAGAAAQPA